MDLYHEGLKFEFVHSYIWCVNCNVWSPMMSPASLWCRGVVVIATAQLHSTKPEPQVLPGSNPARSVSEIRDGEDL